VPGGAEMYRYNVRLMTTTDRTPDAIYQTGLAEVKRIRAEMEAIRKKIRQLDSAAHIGDWLRPIA